MYGSCFEDPDVSCEILWMDAGRRAGASAFGRLTCRQPERRSKSPLPLVPRFAAGLVRDLRVRWGSRSPGSTIEFACRREKSA